MIQTASISALLKNPILSSCVENPPPATVLKLCAIESKKLIPERKYKAAQATVRPTYIFHKAFALSVIFGVSLWLLWLPGSSILYSWPPPIPKAGITATAKTINPIPPIH